MKLYIQVLGVGREELQLQELDGGFRAPSLPVSPAESLSQAEELFTVSWAALYWLLGLMGHLPSLPGCLSSLP